MIEYACVCPHPPVIVAEVGGPRAAETTATIEALRTVACRLADLEIETAVVITPHGPSAPETFRVAPSSRVGGGFDRWGAPQVKLDFRGDPELAAAILERASAVGLEASPQASWGESLDWGCTVPLYHLQPGLQDAAVCPVTTTSLAPESHFLFGTAIAEAVRQTGRRTAVICSADLSHGLVPGAPAGYTPTGKAFDAAYRVAVEGWDRDWMLSRSQNERRRAAEDAVPQTSVLMGCLSDRKVLPRVLSYEAPFGVGYLVAEIELGV
ncbi:MAG: hypothetical protein HY319_25715 [Armatimonadetes bacterium]|nr:hypothetical protein [Armatimonadota bacterium]